MGENAKNVPFFYKERERTLHFFDNCGTLCSEIFYRIFNPFSCTVHTVYQTLSRWDKRKLCPQNTVCIVVKSNTPLLKIGICSSMTQYCIMITVSGPSLAGTWTCPAHSTHSTSGAGGTRPRE